MTTPFTDARPGLPPVSPGRAPRPRGTGPFYFVALAATAVSIDTSWRFFGDRLHITNVWERGAMFAVLEMALVACGYAMRHNVRRPSGKPGAARVLAWALCGLSGYMAVDLAGPVEGFARVALGPVLALVALHLALGIEVKVRRGANTGTWARIATELRERFLSRLGLGDDERKAAERTRDRARDRAARLATASGWVPRRTQRLVKAVRASGATLDAEQRGRLVEQVAVLKNITDLTEIEVDSPWSAAVPPHVQRFVDAAQRSIAAQRAAADRDAAAAIAEAQRTAAALRDAAQHELGEAQQRSAALLAEAQRQIAAMQAAAAAARAAGERAAADMRHAAEEFRRERERAAQQQAERVIAAARDEAARMRSAALADGQALRAAANRSAATPPRRTQVQRPMQRSDAAPSASIGDLVDALHEQWPTEVPSLRAAAQHLRDRFGSCSDRRVADAVAALRARRNGHRDAADAERLQLTAPINGHHPELIGATS